jgi:hypothetical protein
MMGFCGGGTETPCSSTTGNILNSGVALEEDICTGGLDNDDIYFNRIMEMMMMVVISDIYCLHKFVVKLFFI